MAKRLAIPSKEVALRIVGPFDSFFAARVQRLNINTDVPTTTIDELGNSQHAGVIPDVPAITLTFSAFDVSHKIFSVLTGTDPTAYPAAGVDISELGEIDAVVYIKDASVSDYVKTAHAKRLQIRDFTYSYSVTGESTEDYTAVGSEKRWFKNDVILDSWYLTEVAGAPATGEYRIVGTALTTGDTRTAQVIAIYHASAAGDNWSDVSDTAYPAAIRGQDVRVTITAGGQIERVQSITINGNLNPQPVREMGNRAIVGYQKQTATVDGTITVLDTDTELLDLLLNGSISSGATEFELASQCAVSGVDLLIVLYDPCDTSVSGVIVKSVWIPELKLTGDSYTSNVNENAQQVLNWSSDTAQCIV